MLHVAFDIVAVSIIAVVAVVDDVVSDASSYKDGGRRQSLFHGNEYKGHQNININSNNNINNSSNNNNI